MKMKKREQGLVSSFRDGGSHIAIGRLRREQCRKRRKGRCGNHYGVFMEHKAV